MSDQEGLKKFQEKAVRYFCSRPSHFPIVRPYNCCENVLSALKNRLGVGSEVIPKIGAGVSLNRLLCGSVSSVAIAIGMRYGRTSFEENPKPYGTWSISMWPSSVI